MSPIHWRVLIIALGAFATGVAMAATNLTGTDAAIMALFTFVQYCFWRADMVEERMEMK